MKKSTNRILTTHAGSLHRPADLIAINRRRAAGETVDDAVYAGCLKEAVADIARKQRLSDNDADYVDPQDMLAELREDNQRCIASMREAHGLCDEHNDIATASLLENFIDEAEKRVWFLYEAGRRASPSGQ